MPKYDWLVTNLIPRARFSFGQHQERGLSPSPMRKPAIHDSVLLSFMLKFDWLKIENEHSARTQKSDLAKVRVLGADQEKSGPWGEIS